MAQSHDVAAVHAGISLTGPLTRYTVGWIPAEIEGSLALSVREIRYRELVSVDSVLADVPEGAKIEVLHEWEGGPEGLMVKGDHVSDEQFMALMVRDVIARARRAGIDTPGVDHEINIRREWWRPDTEDWDGFGDSPWMDCDEHDEGAFAITFIWDETWGRLLSDI